MSKWIKVKLTQVLFQSTSVHVDRRYMYYILPLFGLQLSPLERGRSARLLRFPPKGQNRGCGAASSLIPKRVRKEHTTVLIGSENDRRKQRISYPCRTTWVLSGAAKARNASDRHQAAQPTDYAQTPRRRWPLLPASQKLGAPVQKRRRRRKRRRHVS